jgi:uncharacterized protein YidB (DUF937 family)
VLRELPGIKPRTVVWLNEAQLYLDTDDERGERVAAGLRALLRDPGRAPVVVLATVWPEYWHALTARPDSGEDRHAQARELLAGHDITVLAKFTRAQMDELTGATDVRMVLAARSAPDGEVIQFLAGAPELLARYRNAPAAARVLIDAAMDARRLGAGVGLPQAFLEAAAQGYLTDAEWDAVDEDWLEQALDYAGEECKGARGPLTRIRPRPARPAARARGEQSGGMAGATGPLYRLADYLDQHGRVHRVGQIPPTSFWSAAAEHAAPGDQAALGDAALAHGLYRDAAQLYKNAAAAGNPRAVEYLTYRLACLSEDPRPASWAVAHAPLDQAFYVRELLGMLRRAGADEQVAMLLARDPAAHVALDNPSHVAWLLDMLRRACADEQVAMLLARDPAAHVALDNPSHVAELLGDLRAAGADEQAAALIARDPAAHVALDSPDRVAELLNSLREAGADEQAAALATRAAEHVPVDGDRMFGVADLLGKLHQAGADEQVAVLAARAVAHIPLDGPSGVASLLDSLREAGADEQAAALLARDPAAHVALDEVFYLDSLLDSLREAGADGQAAALAARAAAHASLDSPGGVASLLDWLREAGADEQAAALLARDPAAHVVLDNPSGLAFLLDSFREAGAHQQAAALAARAAAHIPLDHFDHNQLYYLVDLLENLHRAGADEHAAILAARAAAHIPLDDPHNVDRLLNWLREAGADEQAVALIARDPAAHVAIDDARGVAFLLDSLREAGADEEVAALAARVAARPPLALDDDPREAREVRYLLNRLREAGAHQQATALIARLPALGMFDRFLEQQRPVNQFRFGREADGTPAAPWGWEDLDL